MGMEIPLLDKSTLAQQALYTLRRARTHIPSLATVPSPADVPGVTRGHSSSAQFWRPSFYLSERKTSEETPNVPDSHVDPATSLQSGVMENDAVSS